jgi:hypothetical protein
MTLEEETERLDLLLRGKTISRTFRHRQGEVGFEFSDGTRFFAHHTADGVELSVTGGTLDHD